MSKFKRNLVVGYGLSLTLLIISAAASYVSIVNLLRSADNVNHTQEVAGKLEKVLSALKDAETGQRGYLLTGDDRFLEPYNGTYEETTTLLMDVKSLTNEDPIQQADVEKLKTIAQTRLNFLASLILRKRQGITVPDSLLLIGRDYMTIARETIDRMKNREDATLKQRTETMNRFAASTPVLIIIASIMAILVTLVSLYRVLKDYSSRVKLQNELLKKDEDISRRVIAIESIASEISSGNYKVKVDDAGQDALGNIGTALNGMANSLDTSFTNLSNREWLQTGVAFLNETVIVDQDIPSLSAAVLNFVVEYSQSQSGALYVLNNEGKLERMASFALPEDSKTEFLEMGETLAGQAAQDGRFREMNDLEDSDYIISFSSGILRPRNVVAIPLVYSRAVKGVIELSAMKAYSTNDRAFFDAVSMNTGIAINTAQNRQRVQELLEETQSQTEELQAQHSELENINAELEAQAEKLQASEEELKVQQEELYQANVELEERSRMLEEKNELILDRNLEIQGKAEELELSTKYKSEFLANMSHELRTPLNSILLLSRLMSENHQNNLSADQIEYAQVIQSSGKGLLTLIDEILDLSKIEAGKMELEYTDVNLKELNTELQGLFQPVAKDKGIDFSVYLNENAKSIVETDRLRLEQILRNLISNALKFTRHGDVKLSVESHEGVTSFAVSDTGIGIPADKQLTIFDAFQQADGSTRRQYGGTGLGLSISRQLARLLGGEITLESTEGQGSVFTLMIPNIKGETLPSRTAELEEMRTAPGVSETPAAASRVLIPALAPEEYLSPVIPPAIPDDRENIRPGDKVILIIEDDTAFAKSLLDYTRNKGYKGLVSVRGDEGVTLARQFRPLGILLDIQLPVKSGWEVMDELKADLATKPIPVHMMSSHHAKTRSLAKGAVDFINKPIAFEKLSAMFNKIEEALSKGPKKVMIVEENAKHAQALAYFLQQYNVASEIKDSVKAGIAALSQKEVECVILDMGMPHQQSYETLEEVKKTPGLENVPIIIFTGKNLSHAEEKKIKQYAETIVIKTAHSYQRILDEVSLFLHLVEENKKDSRTTRYKRMGELQEVLKGKTILVADDDVRNIFSLSKSLENYGMEVVSAIDGKDALEQLESKKKIDLVLMDMMMPEMDGYESTRRIRQMPRYRSLPVIAVTAKAMTGDREKCIAAGASDYITKPVDIDQLISLLRVWLYQ